MKKNLLIAAAAVATGATCSAQQLVEAQSIVRSMAATAQVAEFNPTIKAESSASLKAPKAVEDGVFYYRPAGTMYSGYRFGAEGEYAALHVPALTELTYVNGCADAARAQWTLNEQDLSDLADEENNLVMEWSPATSEEGYAAFYSPTISVENKSGFDEFQLTYITMTGNMFLPMLRENLSAAKMYTGFSDGPAWGSGSVLQANLVNEVEGAEPLGIIKSFEKPASPLCIEKFGIYCWSETLNPIPEGKKLTLEIYPLNEDRKKATDEPVEVLYCEEAEILDEFTGDTEGFWGNVWFSKTEEGIFGEELTTPIVIDYAFCIELKGHDDEDVDVRYYLVDVAHDDYEGMMGGPDTFIETRVPDREKPANYYWYNYENGYGYSLPVEIFALYDKVFVEANLTLNDGTECKNCNVVRVSADGSEVQNYGLSGQNNFVIVSSALPFFALDEDGEIVGENYEVVDCPDWLTFSVNDESWAEIGFNYLVPMCEALPADVKGRSAVLYVKGPGYKSETPIVVAQGEVDLDAILADIAGITNIVAPEAVHSAKFNLAGQKVEGKATGLVISNGKKMMNK